MDWNPVDWAQGAARLAGAAWDDIENYFSPPEDYGDPGINNADVPDNVKAYMANAPSYGEGEPKGELKNPNVEALNPGGQVDEGPPYFGANIPRRFENINLQSPDDFQQWLNHTAGVKAALDPATTNAITKADVPPVTPLEGLSAARIASHAAKDIPSPVMPAADTDTTTTPLDFNEPEARQAYAEGLRTGAIKSPQDFAERYAGSYLGSAYGEGVAPPDSAYAAATRGAANLAAALPTNRDLTDTAIGVVKSADMDPTPDNLAMVKGNLVDAWAKDGSSPMELYAKAQKDTAFAAQLTTPPPKPAPPWYARFGAGVGDVFNEANTMIEKAAPDLLHPPGAPGMWVDPSGTEYGGATQYLYQDQLPDNYFADAAKQRLQELRAQGMSDDDWVRTAGQMTATLPLATSLGLTGGWGWIAAGATGGAAYGAFKPDEAENYWTAKAEEAVASGIGGAAGGALLHGGFKLLGKLISKMAPDAADHLAYLFRSLQEPEIPVTDPGAPPGTPPRMVAASEALKPVEPAPLARGIENGREVTITRQQALGQKMEFAPDATPAAKLARVVQDTPENAPASPTLFQDALTKLGATDPETQALAQAHDASAGWLNYLKNTFSDVLTDDSGKLRLFPERPAPAPAETREARILGKNTAEMMLREQANGLAMQTAQHISQGFEPMRKLVSPHLPEWEAGLQKVYDAKGMIERNAAIDSLKQTTIGRYFMAVEGKGALEPKSELNALLKVRQGLNNVVDTDLRAAMANGELTPFQMRDFYLSHMYQKARPTAGFGAEPPVAPRGGSVGFTRQREYDDYFDALAEGHKLKFTNPIDIDVASAQAKLNTLATLHVQKLAKEANFIRTYSGDREAEKADPGWRPLVGLMSKKQVGTAEGKVITHQMYAPPGFARLYNNHIGYVDYTNASETFKNFEDGLLRMKNLSTHLKLLLPLYHMTAEYKEGVAAGVGNSLLEMTGGLKRGDIGEVMRGMRDLAFAPVKPIQYVYQGARNWRPMYRAAEQDPVLAALNPDLKAMQAFVAGGGNIGRRDRVYQESSKQGVTMWRAYARGELGQMLKKDFTGANSVVSTVGLPFKELSWLISSINAPVWDHFIPLLKSGAAMERIQTYLRQNPTADEHAVNFFAKQVVTQMEDRFGEYNMNNLFWRPTMHRVVNQAMLSSSWTYGTVHSLLTGLGWNPGRGLEWNPVATADLIGHLATIAFTNAAWSLAIDGKMPDSYYDYLIPFANARGVSRVILPGQEKEFYDWLGILRKSVSVAMDQGPAAGAREFTGQFGHYVFGKAAPVYSAAAQWLMGEDGIGHKLDYQPGGPIKFLKDAFLPIFLNGEDQAKAAGLNAVENLFGIRGAPKWFQDWEAFRAQEQKLHARWTREELQRAGREAIAAGNPPPAGYNPPRVSTGGSHLTARQRAERAAAGILTDRQAKAGASAYVVRAEGEQTLLGETERQLAKINQAHLNAVQRAQQPVSRMHTQVDNNGAWVHAANRIGSYNTDTGESILRGIATPGTGRQSAVQRYLNHLIRLDRARRSERSFRRRAYMVHGLIRGQEAIGGGAQGV